MDEAKGRAWGGESPGDVLVQSSLFVVCRAKSVVGMRCVEGAREYLTVTLYREGVYRLSFGIPDEVGV